MTFNLRSRATNQIWETSRPEVAQVSHLLSVWKTFAVLTCGLEVNDHQTQRHNTPFLYDAPTQHDEMHNCMVIMSSYSTKPSITVTAPPNMPPRTQDNEFSNLLGRVRALEKTRLDSRSRTNHEPGIDARLGYAEATCKTLIHSVCAVEHDLAALQRQHADLKMEMKQHELSTRGACRVLKGRLEGHAVDIEEVKRGREDGGGR